MSDCYASCWEHDVSQCLIGARLKSWKALFGICTHQQHMGSMLLGCGPVVKISQSSRLAMLQVTDGVFQRLEKCVVMLARGMSLEQVKDSILQDVESYFCSAGLLDDTPQQKPGLRVRHNLRVVHFRVVYFTAAALVSALICSHSRPAAAAAKRSWQCICNRSSGN